MLKQNHRKRNHIKRDLPALRGEADHHGFDIMILILDLSVTDF